MSGLAPQAWENIAARCTHLEGRSFAALRRRGTLPYQAMLAPVRYAMRDNPFPPFRIVIATLLTFGTAYSLLGQLVREFKRPQLPAPDVIVLFVHCVISEEDFSAAYSVMEPDVPFAELR